MGMHGKLENRLNAINNEIKKLNNRLSRLNSWKSTVAARNSVRNYAAARAKNVSNAAGKARTYAAARANNVRRAGVAAGRYVSNAPRKAGSGFFGRLARMGNYAKTQQAYYKSIKPNYYK
jgi:chromosome segregation ATPase